MKIYEIIRQYDNYCDIHEYIVGRFTNKDLADYLTDEFTKAFSGRDRVAYYVREQDLIENDLQEDVWKKYFELLKKEAE